MSVNEENAYQVSSKSLQQYRISCQSAYIFAPPYLRYWMSIYLPLKGFYVAYEEHVYQVPPNCRDRIEYHANRHMSLLHPISGIEMVFIYPKGLLMPYEEHVYQVQQIAATVRMIMPIGISLSNHLGIG
ncbi:hypothetical protein AVEN_200086-1 [Araneus ventricosus]|uniref:Uncharacterized protein n=1 Tax=Araneus ventricosus TaxID=182803 RepID=A0A4Y2PNA8_ARAVE|nr:hypothetical protein AVEN_200086-1 [Araneus ventricosus]